jgi:hypothetical protein
MGAIRTATGTATRDSDQNDDRDIDQDGDRDGRGFPGGLDRRDAPDVALGDAPARIVDWVEQLTASRRAAEYLRQPVPEVADPTGWSQRAFEVAVQGIEQQCREVAAHLARVARG